MEEMYDPLDQYDVNYKNKTIYSELFMSIIRAEFLAVGGGIFDSVPASKSTVEALEKFRNERKAVKMKTNQSV
ncbi:hypothetical protein TIFTF001_032104 [Ficus carica]|uniref:Uncharacterized protein n=1 Tax=Ficus carica TaxID=3494 RepID=A0AA88DWJ0_FICCA|nr:hypothetical protein TIFTF001_032104 [Ficus carica]